MPPVCHRHRQNARAGALNTAARITGNLMSGDEMDSPSSGEDAPGDAV